MSNGLNEPSIENKIELTLYKIQTFGMYCLREG